MALPSRHVSLEQLTASSHPIDNSIQQTLRYGRLHKAEQILADLERTARTLMDPLIEQFGPGVISSGYRSPPLNAAVGGALNSAHLVGLAVDWQPSAKLGDVVRWAVAQPHAELPFDRLILETRGKTTWLHVQAAEQGAASPRVVFASPRGGVYQLLSPSQIAVA